MGKLAINDGDSHYAAQDLTDFLPLRKIDITNKEVPKSAFFVSLKGFLAGTWFLQK